MTAVSSRPAGQTSLTAALEYYERGLTPLPLIGKTPPKDFRWKWMQRRRPMIEDVRSWWTDHPGANVGLVCGSLSGIAVLDLDSEAKIRRAEDLGLPERVPTVRTSRGIHLYFRDGGFRSAKVEDMELRAEGMYVVAPPSIHPDTGVIYTWEIELEGVLPALPSWARPAGRNRAGTIALLRGVPYGERNHTAYQLAQRLLQHGHPEAEVEEWLALWNAGNEEPLLRGELRATVASATKGHRRRLEETLPDVEADILAFLGHPVTNTLPHGTRSTYLALCRIEWWRGRTRGDTLRVSYRQLHAYGAVTPSRVSHALRQLAGTRLIDFRPGRDGSAASVRRLPLPTANDSNGAT